MDVAQVGNVLARLNPPVWLVTSANGGARGGFIATTVTTASIVSEMPRLLITVNKRHFTYALIESSGALAMHLIDESRLDLVYRFGLHSGRDTDKFAGLEFKTGITGSPLVSGAVAWVDCRVESKMDSGDRSIYLVAVVDGQLEATTSILTSDHLFAIASPDQKKIMREQYEHDSRLDARAIRQWREEAPRNAQGLAYE